MWWSVGSEGTYIKQSFNEWTEIAQCDRRYSSSGTRIFLNELVLPSDFIVIKIDFHLANVKINDKESPVSYGYQCCQSLVN